MTKPRTAQEQRKTFIFQLSGRAGRIKYWPRNGLFATYFRFAGKPVRNTFKTWDAAYEYLENEFKKLDGDRLNSAVAHPVGHNLNVYSEMEERLRQVTGATLLNAMNFYIDHHESKKIEERKVPNSAGN